MRFLLAQYLRVYVFDKWMMLHFSVMGHIFLGFLLAAGVFGIDTAHSNTYQLFVLLLLLLVLACANSVFCRLKITLSRQLPRYGTVDEALHYRLSLTNLGSGSYDGLALCEQLEEKLPNYAQLKNFYQTWQKPWFKRMITYKQWLRFIRYQRGGAVNETLIPEALASKPLSIAVEFVPIRRGIISFTSTFVAKPELLGLFRRLIKVDNPQSLLILPKRYNISIPEPEGQRKYQAGGVSLANSVGNSSEFMSLREYHYGDPLNSIHWKSYAKHGQLIVKEYRDEYFVRRSLLLDTFSGNAPLLQFEAAVSIAASLLINEQNPDALLDLLFVSSNSYCFTAGRGVDDPEHLLEILASVQAQNKDNFSQTGAMVFSKLMQCSSLVCVLMHWDDVRQKFISQCQAHDLPVLVFLLHDGSLKREHCANIPARFYLIDYKNIEAGLKGL